MGLQYVITDGLKYIKLDRNQSIVYVTNADSAEKYDYDKAVNIRDNNLGAKNRAKFYVAEYEPKQKKGKKLKPALSIVKALPATPTVQSLSGEKININFDKMIEEIEYLMDNIYMFKDQLSADQQRVDWELSDIEHFIQEYAPAAHIRTKVYSKQREKRLEREKIRRNVKFANIIIECIDQGCGLPEIKNRLREAEFKPYKGRTELYNELLEWIG